MPFAEVIVTQTALSILNGGGMTYTLEVFGEDLDKVDPAGQPVCLILNSMEAGLVCCGAEKGWKLLTSAAVSWKNEVTTKYTFHKPKGSNDSAEANGLQIPFFHYESKE